MERSELVELIERTINNSDLRMHDPARLPGKIADGIMKRWILLNQDSCPACLSEDPKVYGSGPNPCADPWHAKTAEK